MKITPFDTTPIMNIQVVISTPASVTESSAVSSVTPAAAKVQISNEGQEKLESEKNADIDQSGLPEDVKEVLKNIRKLQDKIAEKNQELMELLNDKTLSEDDKKRQRELLTSTIRSMQSALSQATSALNNAMSSNNMDSDSRSQEIGVTHCPGTEYFQGAQRSAGMAALPVE
jgi:peptidoglycan hydrolase CwlO-like protein